MDQLLSGPLAERRLSTTLLSGFALVALLLAAIGLYGVMASAVREETHDIGVRMALGATPGFLWHQVLRRALAVACVGLAVGLVGDLFAARLVRSLLFDVKPSDPVAAIGACSVLFVIAVLAAYVPARRASAVIPLMLYGRNRRCTHDHVMRPLRLGARKPDVRASREMPLVES